MRVSLFITCFNDTLFPETGKAMVRLLERLGHIVEFRREQTCCGQMHVNTGYQREAVPLVRRFVEVFRDANVVMGLTKTQRSAGGNSFSPLSVPYESPQRVPPPKPEAQADSPTPGAAGDV